MLQLDKRQVRAVDSGEVFARFVDCSKVELTLDGFHSQTMKLRFTDLALLKTSPFGLLFLLLGEYLGVSRPNANRVQMQVFNRDTILANAATGDALEIKLAWRNSLFVEAQLMLRGELVCLATIELQGPIVARYDITRRLDNAAKFTQHSKRTREWDNQPVQCLLYPFKVEALDVGFCCLQQGSLAVSEVFEHVFDAESAFHTERQLDGLPKYTCFWRSAVVQVLDPLADISQGLIATSWVQRTGGSSFDLRMDMSLASSPSNAVVVAAQITLVVIDIPSKRPATAMYDKAWAERRYAYGKQSPVSMESFEMKANANSWSHPSFQCELELRHADQDINQHVNSAKYLVLVQEARSAATRAGYLPLVAGATLSTKSFIEYLGELHLDPDHPASVQVQFQLAENHTLYEKYTFRSKPNEGNVSALVYVETALFRNKL
ncbi:hypothetical protein BASA81_011252 [Batrachochytrium salamandrivorans]|nr:hypothetical protein BASA81_011252 [Batrachochytrium salamandrivorans]